MFRLYKHMPGSNNRSKKSKKPNNQSKKPNNQSKKPNNRSKIAQKYMFHTQLMVDFLRQYIIRTDAFPRGIDFSEQDIKLMSDVEYLKGISESIGFGLSPLEVWVLLVFDRNSKTKEVEVKELLQIVSVMYGHKLDIDEIDVLVSSLHILMTPHAEKGMIEQIYGGNKSKMLNFTFQVVRLYVIYLTVTYMGRSLEHRTANSKTTNYLMEFMKNSNCKKTELNPLLSLITKYALNTTEVSILQVALMLGSSEGEGEGKGKGKCLKEEYTSTLQVELFAEDESEYSGQVEYPGLNQTQKYSSALVLAGPNSVVPYDLTDNTAAKAAAKKIRSMSAKSDLDIFKTYMAIIDSTTTNQKDFEKQLAQLTDTPSQGSVVNIKEEPSMLSAAAYVLGVVGDQARMYWSDVRDFGLLNPIPFDDVWNELKDEARRKITHYRRLVEDGTLAMDKANDELWAWIKHATILFLLTKTGIYFGVSLTVSLVKELISWRASKPAPFAIEPGSNSQLSAIEPGSNSQLSAIEPGSNSQLILTDEPKSQLKWNCGKRTRKIKK